MADSSDHSYIGSIDGTVDCRPRPRRMSAAAHSPRVMSPVRRNDETRPMTATTKPRRVSTSANAGTARLWSGRGPARPTPEERAALGKDLRKLVPLAQHAEVARD